MERGSPPRRSCGDSAVSPEFEFWMVGNNHPDLEPNLHTADELIVDGVLLPLHLLSMSEPRLDSDSDFISESKPELEPKSQEVEAEPVAVAHPESSICYCTTTTPTPTGSKRWKDIFKVGEKKKESATAEEKEKKKERKPNGGAAELNINIWPFSRSRSAGTGRPKISAAAMRKSSSAPCSRSNSRGENTAAGGRRWAASPGRPGVHVGRASPVWQVKRAGKGPESGMGRPGPKEKGRKGLNGVGVRGLNLNVNSCIGYGNQCRGEEGGGGNGSLFKFKALFAKKVY